MNLPRSRYFFVGLGVLCMVLAVLGFAPNLARDFRGELYFPPIVHLHGIIMMGWLALYTTQAAFVVRGDLGRHRRLGVAAAAYAFLMWLIMGVAQITALKRYDPDQFGFIVLPMLITIGTLVLFPLFVTWAVLARRQADWHKRMMTFATLLLVQAALDRMHWLPHEGLPMFWHHGLRLYVLLLLPLFIFDVVKLRRLHPATLIGSALIVGMHGVVSYYWGHPGWMQVSRAFWIWLRQS